MSRYNLDHFPPLEFQRFCGTVIRLESEKPIVPLTHKGPDGGIDAYSYDNRDIYQVKHHDVGYLGTKRINSVVRQEFLKEFLDFTRRHGEQMHIQRYTFVTNVRLYKETIDHIVAKVCEAADVECFVWDYGFIETVLDTHESLRKAWFEQVGDIVERLSREAEALRTNSERLERVEARLSEFASRLTSTPPPSPERPDAQTLETVENEKGDLQSRLRIAELLHGKTGEVFLDQVLRHLMVDYSLLLSLPKIRDDATGDILDPLRNSLRELTATAVSNRTLAGLLFTLGCIAEPLMFEDQPIQEPDAICQEAALEAAASLPRDWLCSSLLELFGKSRAMFVSGFIAERTRDLRTLTSVFFHDVNRDVSKRDVNSLRLPKAAAVLERFKESVWIGATRVLLPQEMRAQVAEFSERVLMSLASKNLPVQQRIVVTISYVMEHFFGLTLHDCDAEDFDRVATSLQENFVRELMPKSIRAELEFSEEEFEDRRTYESAITHLRYRKLSSGVQLGDLPYETYSRMPPV